ncbi:hypothetical protein AC578_10563 [Pseudocercospora eumusae]|uniref:RING-type domain-containing protein n=1 Tax=Pseudocercospora eumusae TaxID=321146 RepID=A0A139H5H2_9PEZI|nr:hypothetical protein AC578_10563 [Pseudocercospora eumusae]
MDVQLPAVLTRHDIRKVLYLPLFPERKCPACSSRSQNNPGVAAGLDQWRANRNNIDLILMRLCHGKQVPSATIHAWLQELWRLSGCGACRASAVVTRTMLEGWQVKILLAFNRDPDRSSFFAPEIPTFANDYGEEEAEEEEAEDCAVCLKTIQVDEVLVACKPGCGKSIHATCFANLAATKSSGVEALDVVVSGEGPLPVSCPSCRWPLAAVDMNQDRLQTIYREWANAYPGSAANPIVLDDDEAEPGEEATEIDDGESTTFEEWDLEDMVFDDISVN